MFQKPLFCRKNIVSDVPLYFRRRYRKNQVVFSLVFNVGSAQDDLEHLGLAHFTEHLIFNWNREDVRGTVAQILDSDGDILAQTFTYCTCFKSIIHPANLDQSISVFYKLFCQPLITRSYFNIERDRILKELESTASGRLVDKVNVSVLGDYARSYCIGGYRDTLHKIRIDDIQRFYEQFYVKNRLSIILVGGIDSDIFLSRMSPMLDSIPAGNPLIPALSESQPYPNNFHRIVDDLDMSERIYRGFRMKAYNEIYINLYYEIIQTYVKSEFEGFAANIQFKGKWSVELDRRREYFVLNIKIFDTHGKKIAIANQIQKIINDLRLRPLDRNKFWKTVQSLRNYFKIVINDPGKCCSYAISLINSYGKFPEITNPLDALRRLNMEGLHHIAGEELSDMNHFEVVN